MNLWESYMAFLVKIFLGLLSSSVIIDSWTCLLAHLLLLPTNYWPCYLGLNFWFKFIVVLLSFFVLFRSISSVLLPWEALSCRSWTVYLLCRYIQIWSWWSVQANSRVVTNCKIWQTFLKLSLHVMNIVWYHESAHMPSNHGVKGLWVVGKSN